MIVHKRSARDFIEFFSFDFTRFNAFYLHFFQHILERVRALHFCFVLFQQTNFSNVVLLFALHLNLIAYSKQYAYLVYLWQFSFAFAILCWFERAQVTLKNVSIELSWYHWMFQSLSIKYWLKIQFDCLDIALVQPIKLRTHFELQSRRHHFRSCLMSD